MYSLLDGIRWKGPITSVLHSIWVIWIRIRIHWMTGLKCSQHLSHLNQDINSLDDGAQVLTDMHSAHRQYLPPSWELHYITLRGVVSAWYTVANTHTHTRMHAHTQCSLTLLVWLQYLIGFLESTSKLSHYQIFPRSHKLREGGRQGRREGGSTKMVVFAAFFPLSTCSWRQITPNSMRTRVSHRNPLTIYHFTSLSNAIYGSCRKVLD